MIVAPGGAVQLYNVAPETAAIEYPTEDGLPQIWLRPEIAPIAPNPPPPLETVPLTAMEGELCAPVLLFFATI